MSSKLEPILGIEPKFADYETAVLAIELYRHNGARAKI